MPNDDALGRSRSKLTVTVPEAARLLGLGRTAAYEAARQKQLPVLRIGGRLLVPIAELEKLLGARPGSLMADQSATEIEKDDFEFHKIEVIDQ